MIFHYLCPKSVFIRHPARRVKLEVIEKIIARQGVSKSLTRGEGFRVGVTNIKARGPTRVLTQNRLKQREAPRAE